MLELLLEQMTVLLSQWGLALLDSTDIPHPPLEFIATVDEEIGMLGAYAGWIEVRSPQGN